MGDETIKKPGYDTFENQELIAMNRRLFEQSGYSGNYMMEFSSEAMRKIQALNAEADIKPYQGFVTKCSRHSPWIWKDPRLWLTIRFWAPLLPLRDCRFILLTRDAIQTWVSQTLRRQITTLRYSRNYERRIQQSITEFFHENAVPHLHVRYDDLILNPAQTISHLNRHLGLSLSVEDLEQVYHKPLYKSPRSSFIKHLQAMSIYLKNYSERLDVSSDSN